MQNKIIIAIDKEYRVPNNNLYLPIHAGAAGHAPLPYIGDDSGDQISEKNNLYCELTALYWAWKNLPDDIIGLFHYRRYFREPKRKEILTEKSMLSLLKNSSVILPKKRHYWIETGKSQFIHAHGSYSLEVLEKVLSEKYPDYVPAYNLWMNRTYGHRFNMMIMPREQLNRYCTWLFDLLFEVERNMNTPSPRIMGHLAERLLDVWIETTKTTYTELPVLYTEPENWIKKGSSFLRRKFIRKEKLHGS